MSCVSGNTRTPWRLLVEWSARFKLEGPIEQHKSHAAKDEDPAGG
jgi:hypothetical protein